VICAGPTHVVQPYFRAISISTIASEPRSTGA
jgi:hypothetical protein